MGLRGRVPVHTLDVASGRWRCGLARPLGVGGVTTGADVSGVVELAGERLVQAIRAVSASEAAIEWTLAYAVERIVSQAAVEMGIDAAELRRRNFIRPDEMPFNRGVDTLGTPLVLERSGIGDPAVFVSVDAMHQGPHGGGPVVAIIDAGE